MRRCQDGPSTERETGSLPLAKGPPACMRQIWDLNPGGPDPKQPPPCQTTDTTLLLLEDNVHQRPGLGLCVCVCGWLGWEAGTFPGAERQTWVGRETQEGAPRRCGPWSSHHSLVEGSGPGQGTEAPRGTFPEPGTPQLSPFSGLTPDPVWRALARGSISPSFFLFLRHSDLGCGAAFALWEKLVFVGKLWRYDSEDTQGAASWCQGAALLMS